MIGACMNSIRHIARCMRVTQGDVTALTSVKGGALIRTYARTVVRKQQMVVDGNSSLTLTHLSHLKSGIDIERMVSMQSMRARKNGGGGNEFCGRKRAIYCRGLQTNSLPSISAKFL